MALWRPEFFLLLFFKFSLSVLVFGLALVLAFGLSLHSVSLCDCVNFWNFISVFDVMREEMESWLSIWLCFWFGFTQCPWENWCLITVTQSPNLGKLILVLWLRLWTSGFGFSFSSGSLRDTAIKWWSWIWFSVWSYTIGPWKTWLWIEKLSLRKFISIYTEVLNKKLGRENASQVRQ